jgi:hypothetical protein
LQVGRGVDQVIGQETTERVAGVELGAKGVGQSLIRAVEREGFRGLRVSFREDHRGGSGLMSGCP